MLRIGFSGYQRVQHGTARDAKHIGDHVRQLDVGRLQQFMHAVGGFDPISDEALAMAREIAQVADRWRRNEACADKPVREKVRDPLAVLHVGLAARHRLDVVRIGQDYFEAALEQVEDRFPVHARGLHRHMRARRLCQPLVKPEQFAGRRAES